MVTAKESTLETTNQVVSHQHVGFIATIVSTVILSVICIIIGRILSIRLKKIKQLKSDELKDVDSTDTNI